MQQELITLHRRIEATDTTLGILVTAGVALALYQMQNKHLWHAAQFPFVVITMLGTLSCVAGLVLVTNEDVDWLHLMRFEHGMAHNPAKQLGSALEGGKQAFLGGQLVERTKVGLARLGALILAAGATGYMTLGQKDGGWWLLGLWAGIGLLGLVRAFVVRLGR